MNKVAITIVDKKGEKHTRNYTADDNSFEAKIIELVSLLVKTKKVIMWYVIPDIMYRNNDILFPITVYNDKMILTLKTEYYYDEWVIAEILRRLKEIPQFTSGEIKISGDLSTIECMLDEQISTLADEKKHLGIIPSQRTICELGVK